MRIFCAFHFLPLFTPDTCWPESPVCLRNLEINVHVKFISAPRRVTGFPRTAQTTAWTAYSLLAGPTTQKLILLWDALRLFESWCWHVSVCTCCLLTCATALKVFAGITISGVRVRMWRKRHRLVWRIYTLCDHFVSWTVAYEMWLVMWALKGAVFKKWKL
jgi:hypothetical protein